MTMKTKRIRIRDERGQSMTEFAIVLPILVVLLFGIVQFGILFNNYVTLTDAVRAGARAAAVSRQSAESDRDCDRGSAVVRQRSQPGESRGQHQLDLDAGRTGDRHGHVSRTRSACSAGSSARATSPPSRRRQSNEQQARERPGNGADGSVPRRPARDGGARARRRVVVPREAPTPADGRRGGTRRRAGAAGKPRERHVDRASVREDERAPRDVE